MRIATLFLLAGAGGCNGADKDPTTDDEQDCAGADTYVDGISQTAASGRTVTFVSAAPTPPDVGDNQWTVEVLDAGGAPEAAMQLSLTPYMPLHGHGLVPPEYGSTEVGAGTYEIEMFDLIMAGLWQFTIDVGEASDTGAPGASESVVFMFCAEG
jgi:hypothetical protein